MLNLVKSRLSGKTLFFIFIFLYSFLYATIINVPTPYATIQAGIDAAANGDIVLVQPGTYVENINYNGKLITVASLFLTTQDTSYVSSTIIDGNSSGSVVTFESGEDITAILCGFTITNGLGGGINPNFYGGGIFCNSSSPNLQNVTITNNSTTYNGGGIYCHTSSPNLENVIISFNSANSQGGGIYSHYYSPSLQNVTISGNSASQNGGGIYCQGSSPSLMNVTISGNTSNYPGGGIYCYGSSPSLINSIMWNNSPQEIYIWLSGSVTATYSDIEGSWTGTGNIDSDPLFVNPSSGNYHLQATSPCIDAGDPASPLDPDGTNADMGAYYFNQYNGPIWHISKTGSDESGVGTEQYPFYTIQHGIDFSTDADTVLVHLGTYVENINYIGKNITIGSLFLTTQDTSYISSTIIDGNSSSSVVTFESGEDSTAILSGFTITNGSSGNGGGIHCENSSNPSLNNLSVENNISTGHGGGIYCWNSNPGLENITISDNSADSKGGGIYCYVSSLSLNNVTISGNVCFESGGGIYCESFSFLSLNNVIITSNFSYNEGGGIYCLYAAVSLENATISGNSGTTGYNIYCGYGSNAYLKNFIL